MNEVIDLFGGIAPCNTSQKIQIHFFILIITVSNLYNMCTESTQFALNHF